MKKINTKEEFDAIADEFGRASPLIVQLEDKRMGMCNHFTDEHVLVDAYRGNDHECLRVPYSNFFHLGNGALFAGLNHVLRG